MYDGRTSIVQKVTNPIGSKVAGLAPQTGVGANTAIVTKGNALANTNNTSQIASFTYTPFGEQLGKVGGEKVTGFNFNGEYFNGATGMLNLRARQYEPTMNRFSQKDLLRGSLANPLSLNRYHFTINDPLNWIDSDGLSRTAPIITSDGNSRPSSQERVPISKTVNSKVKVLADKVVKSKTQSRGAQEKAAAEFAQYCSANYKYLNGTNKQQYDNAVAKVECPPENCTRSKVSKSMINYKEGAGKKWQEKSIT